jgi:NitT/TauT family transport system permease protein
MDALRNVATGPLPTAEPLSVHNTSAVVAAAVRAAARQRFRSTVAVWLARFGVAGGALTAWQLAATYWVDPFYYSKPTEIWWRLRGWVIDGTQFGPLWTQVEVTMKEAAFGFLIGAAAGVAAGVLLARGRFLPRVFGPFIHLGNAVPRIVLASLFIILFGLGPSSKIATVVFMVFFAVFFEAFRSVRDIDRACVQEAYLFGARSWQALRYVILPIASPRILASLHPAFGIALIGAVVGEYIGAEKGLGVLIYHAQASFDVAGIYAGMIVTTFIALAAEWTLSVLERRLT